jgi:hypothetical protein
MDAKLSLLSLHFCALPVAVAVSPSGLESCCHCCCSNYLFRKLTYFRNTTASTVKPTVYDDTISSAHHLKPYSYPYTCTGTGGNGSHIEPSDDG